MLFTVRRYLIFQSLILIWSTILHAQEDKIEAQIRFNGTAFYEIKPDRQPVSILHGELKPFTYKEFELLEGDIVYCTSDGYQDQFGGEKGKKFMAKRFKQLLMDIQHMKLCDQKAHLDETIERWKDPEGTGVNS